jgi:hypothetical protein
MKGTPFSKAEFLYCYPVLKKLWQATDKAEIEKLKVWLVKFRTTYNETNDEMGVFRK